MIHVLCPGVDSEASEACSCGKALVMPDSNGTAMSAGRLAGRSSPEALADGLSSCELAEAKHPCEAVFAHLRSAHVPAEQHLVMRYMQVPEKEDKVVGSK